MESIKDIYTIGFGPSSSHTMGPQKAAEEFKKKYPHAELYKVILYGSLAATGKGHFTDQALYKVLGARKTTVEWKPEEYLPLHPNGMEFVAYFNKEELGRWKVFSVGGGTIRDEKNFYARENDIYDMSTMQELLAFCDNTGRAFWEIVDIYEDSSIWDYLETVWKAMKDAIFNGLNNEGVLPGPLRIARKAASYNMKANNIGSILGGIGVAFSYALAVAEENATGNTVVTAPTCGSAGVLPAVLLFLKHTYQISDTRIVRAIATAGLIGNIIKTNASISGAEVGCQGEIGTACAMASGAAAQILGGSPAQ
ncbi:MAG TPA: L-serine ammonia-lyase, iron-sulfur-dependent, subunit alpha, partial [Candidatus Cloacimonadota bacterium]|nr:L-serine ammonia-lyase, iron-sulfur-dependent, subunit alpha [Candidatus Cloacimonadota bacterium]